jgi:hypothetical protein
MNGLLKGLDLLPAARGHLVPMGHDLHGLDPADHEDVRVGVHGEDQVVVAVKAHEAGRVAMTYCQTKKVFDN